ncbi:hypothetical protein B0I37DRAFT_356536 [Chaetomium sp. MPI-CAGE-AT-0009]|nr:hypothetical protein B0I37DRAFT_356536 [Chaetomium sp. MPI-CAGE-AT-0009]
MATIAPGGMPPPPPPPGDLGRQPPPDAPDIPTQDGRQCQRCHRTLPLSEFVNKRNAKKLTLRCAECRGLMVAEKSRSRSAVELLSRISGTVTGSKRNVGDADLSSPERQRIGRIYPSTGGDGVVAGYEGSSTWLRPLFRSRRHHARSRTSSPGRHHQWHGTLLASFGVASRHRIPQQPQRLDVNKYRLGGYIVSNAARVRNHLLRHLWRS